VAVAVELKNTSAQPWTVDAEGVALVGKGGGRLRVLRVWQPEPILPGGDERGLVVEAEATAEQARGTCRIDPKSVGEVLKRRRASPGIQELETR
jgi:hypothetical protein